VRGAGSRGGRWGTGRECECVADEMRKARCERRDAKGEMQIPRLRLAPSLREGNKNTRVFARDDKFGGAVGKTRRAAPVGMTCGGW
jgi:hypothetical protein